MTDYAEFFLGSKPSVALYDCFEIAHPNFSQTYRIVRNAPDGLSVNQALAGTEWVFDGDDDNVLVGDVLHFERTDEFSFAFWFRSETSQNGALIANTQADSTGRGYVFHVRTTSPAGLSLEILNDSLGNADCVKVYVPAASFDLLDGQEHCVVATYDGSGTAAGVDLYIDGDAQATTTLSDTLSATIVPSSANLRIGGRDASGFGHEGMGRDASIWSVRLSPAQVTELHNGGTPGDLLEHSAAANLELWFKLDGDDTDAPDGVIDHSGNDRAGTANFAPVSVDAFVDYDYYPARVMPIASSDDLVQALSITLGDVGDVIARENATVWAANGMNTRPTLTYRGYRSDNLDAPIYGPITLEISNVTRSREGCAFEARAAELNASRTGELYTVERFPMLRGFL